MKQVLIILIPVMLLGISLAGGFTGNPLNTNVTPADVYELTEKTPDSTKNVLQIQNLIPKPTAIPNPTTSGSVPTATPTSGSCTTSTKVAIDLLLDTSGSMDQGEKILKLKSAVSQFGNNIKPDDLVGIQSFSSKLVPTDYRPTCIRLSLGNDVPACEVLPVGNFNSVTFNQALNLLFAGGDTYMRSGFELAKQVIGAKKSLPQYKDYNWVLIFLSDGVPNDSNILGPGPDETQNPNAPPSIAEQIRSQGVRIISIGLDLDSLPLGLVAGAKDLIRSTSSPEVNGQKNYYESPTANDLQNIYNSIATSICR